MSLFSELLSHNAIHKAIYYDNVAMEIHVCQVGCIHKLIPANS